MREMPKRVSNPKAKWSEKPRSKPEHKQRNFEVSAEQPGVGYRFRVYQRQNLKDENNFSCGISYLPKGSPPLTLARYNGSNHRHLDIVYQPHIHRASQEAIAQGKRAESMATATDRFSTLEGALACLIKDFRIRGLVARPDQARLFS